MIISVFNVMHKPEYSIPSLRSWRAISQAYFRALNIEFRGHRTYSFPRMIFISNYAASFFGFFKYLVSH